ncbi:hypothetical protein BDV25DRAFT_128885 [Aspergillus avenaceus]|uniref:Aminoglycoside phosphotransferase domain-containing protein n=1 Tax=Aspergillus avenaceus TaxID=36643 RepID=A0A5N6TY78_ASPAV|nr:hypothetical protein BDV25DRAFT_128885 [Aspergillus avenaceus]
MSENESFAGYRWSYFSSMSEGPLRVRAQTFLDSIDWDALLRCASAKRNGVECRLLPDIGLGYNHMVRVVEFVDQVQWVARLRMPRVDGGDAGERIKSEYETIRLVQKESKIPVPHVHMLETDLDSHVGAQFMLMDCLRGNVGMDLSFSILPENKPDAYAAMAEVQIEMFKIRLPKIGKVVGVNDDGSYRLGPIPALGGPFDTAAEYFKAWAAKAEFGPFVDEILSSVSTFRKLLADNAEWLSVNNTGPFPLCHDDFGHNNIVFDDNYRLLGVIDWETAFAAPCEISGEFPLSISLIPPAMDAPWNYDETEEEQGLTEGYTLSSALQDNKRQYLASAMRLYQNGKAGWYSKVMEELRDDR